MGRVNTIQLPLQSYTSNEGGYFRLYDNTVSGETVDHFGNGVSGMSEYVIDNEAYSDVSASTLGTPCVSYNVDTQRVCYSPEIPVVLLSNVNATAITENCYFPTTSILRLYVDNESDETFTLKATLGMPFVLDINYIREKSRSVNYDLFSVTDIFMGKDKLTENVDYTVVNNNRIRINKVTGDLTILFNRNSFTT